MKKILLSIIYFLTVIFFIQAQALYSVTPDGGNNKSGSINKFIPATNNLTIAKSFDNVPSGPAVDLIQASDGKLYGMVTEGTSNAAVIFSFDPLTSVYTRLKYFDSPGGGSMVLASDGKFYGVSGGGNSGFGLIFSFDPSTLIYTKLRDFNQVDGCPFGGLIQASDGKIYGVTGDGSPVYGSIFSFDISTFTYRKLLEFDDSSGIDPSGGLIQAKDGKLYGVTGNGGSLGCGIIFSFDLSSFTYKTLMEFDDANGAHPSGSLIEASDGKLYGLATSGGAPGYGVIFSFDATTSSYTKLKEFNGVNGAFPEGSLTQASNGKLYGVTGGGLHESPGVIFCFDPSTFAYTTPKSFKGFYRPNGVFSYDGATPIGSLILASDGKLYGMTAGGGNVDEYSNTSAGVIFSFDPSSSKYLKLREIASNESGSTPSASLVHATDGKLYGLTAYGARGNGGIFSFDPSSSIFKRVKDFDLSSGTSAFGSLIQARDGKLYGMTSEGGSGSNGYNFFGAGVIFSFDPSSSTYTKLKDFDYEDGDGAATPNGSLTQASDGKLYGMTSEGGNFGGGVIFSLDPSSSTYTVVNHFDDSNGFWPLGSLTQASDGKLYGMTYYGGKHNGGVLFSFDPISSTYKKLVDLIGNPEESLVQATDGKLYGTIQGREGGSNGNIFSFDPTSAIFTKLKDFDSMNVGMLRGSLMQASDGKLYGSTHEGGRGGGVIFSFDPSSSIYTKLKDYPGVGGIHSFFGGAFIEVAGTNPTVSLLAPANNATYLSGGNVYIKAVASDANGTISKVEFYNGATLLHTATDTPYTFKWIHILKGNYTLTAKATDKDGLVTTTDTVHISVVNNKPPLVNIINPVNNQTFIAGASINLEAAAQDIDGKIAQVRFYNGATRLATENKFPYSYQWHNVHAGTYTINAVGRDNWGSETTSASITVTVTSRGESPVSKSGPANIKTGMNDEVSLKLSPSPVSSILNICTSGLKSNKRSTMSIISASGAVIKTMQIVSSAQTVKMNVSSLASGVYVIKITTGNNILYRQFLKL